MLHIGVLCNTASIEANNNGFKEIGDPLETGLLKYAYKQNIIKRNLEQQFQKLNEAPFSSETKMMATLHKTQNGFIVFAKGATEELLNSSSHIFSNSGNVELTEQVKKNGKKEHISSQHPVYALLQEHTKKQKMKVLHYLTTSHLRVCIA